MHFHSNYRCLSDQWEKSHSVYICIWAFVLYLKLHVGLSELFCFLLQRHHPHFSLLPASCRCCSVSLQKLSPTFIRVLIHYPPASSTAGGRRLQRLGGLHLLGCRGHLKTQERMGSVCWWWLPVIQLIFVETIQANSTRGQMPCSIRLCNVDQCNWRLWWDSVCLRYVTILTQLKKRKSPVSCHSRL